MERTDPELLPMRVAERMGRLSYWVMGLDLDRREREVAMHLVTEGGRHLDSWSSHASIGACLGVSGRVVGEAVRSLAAKGLLTKTRRHNPDGTRSSDRIRLLAPPHLMEIRQTEADLATNAHEGNIDFAHRLESGTHETCVPETTGTHETCEEPSTTYRDLEREEGSSHETCVPLPERLPRAKRRRLPRSSSELFGGLAA